MKCHETHFEEYIHSNNKFNIHPKLEKCYDKFPTSIGHLKNILLYGPPGVGKYTQALKIINKYSSSNLKYEKKMTVSFNKQTYFFKISDIHFEIDLSLLGCNSKLLWHEIYTQITDIVSSRVEKNGIILLKYFHDTHNELLDNFYSYMQTNITNSHCNLIFIFLTEHLSFLPEKILNCCQIIHVPRPSKSSYIKCKKNQQNRIPFKNFICGNNPDIIPNDEIGSSLKSKKTKTSVEVDIYKIKNIKSYYNEIPDTIEKQMDVNIRDKIIYFIKNQNLDNFQYITFRDLLYDILIYNTDIYECVWYVFSTLAKDKWIPKEKIDEMMKKTCEFLKYYNNNYRPIYHMEKYFLSFIHLKSSIDIK